MWVSNLSPHCAKARTIRLLCCNVLAPTSLCNFIDKDNALTCVECRVLLVLDTFELHQDCLIRLVTLGTERGRGGGDNELLSNACSLSIDYIAHTHRRNDVTTPFT
jgi:hypothetical protein